MHFIDAPPVMATPLLLELLLAYEISAGSPPDGRRVISDERQTVQTAHDQWSRLVRARASREAISAARQHLDIVSKEARRVLCLWNGEQS